MHVRSNLPKAQMPPGASGVPTPGAGGSLRSTLATLAALLVLLLIGLISLPGCGGCWGGNQSAQAKKKKEEDEEKDKEKKKKKKLEKPKDDFEPLAVRMLPSNDPTPSLKAPPVLVKPGHWIAVSTAAKANNFDFPGELATFVEQQATQQPLELEDGVTRLGSWCPAILPKGQAKRIESLFYVPRRKEELGKVYSLRNELRGARGGRTEAFSTNISNSLKDYEHLIVVLAANSTNPAAYSHFDKLLSVKMPAVGDSYDVDAEPVRYFHVMRPSCERSAPVPSHPLAWTTIAFVFWDDLNPAVLTNFQQQALLDWLHWGGQLIISGPSSLDKLKGSFLEPYLPAQATETVKLEQAAFDELNRRFSLRRDPLRANAFATPQAAGDELSRITVLPERPMLGIDLERHAESRDVNGTGGLVVERRVGGGRIVVTRFPLTDVRIKQWRNFDGFFNAVLLRRPPRIFSQDPQLAQFNMKWDNPQLGDMLLETRINTTLRYFSRDVGNLTEEPWTYEIAGETPAEPPADPALPGGRGKRPGRGGGMSGSPVFGAPGFGGMPPGMMDFRKVLPDTSNRQPDLDDWHFAGYEARRPLGIAAWNDEGAASKAAHQALTDGAGIQIPRADFVLKVLAIYLLVLVPLNWLVFWTIGRVEWAWIAAPLIAIGGAAAVIRLAQLDIGFARSRTEVAILEVQGGYERAHLTRYSALYTSLSSTYTLGFEDSSALSMPFTVGPKNDNLLAISEYADVAFRRDKEMALTGVQVSSNSTGMVHSEQMLPLGENPKVTESLLLVGDDTKGYSVRNTTDLVLRDVGVFRRVDVPGADGEPLEYSPQIETAYIPKIDAATSAPLKFEPLVYSPPKKTEETVRPGPPTLLSLVRKPYPRVWLPAWNKAPIFSSGTDSDTDGNAATDATRVRLTRLALLATDRLRLLPGDVRLVGWTDQRLPGMRIRPEAPQNFTYTLVVAHLARGSMPRVRTDRNRAEDYLDPAFFDEEAMQDVPLELSEPAATNE